MRYRLKLDRLTALLAASRVSQNHWAIRLGLSRGHWSDIVNGRHPYPSARTRQRMLEVFGVPSEELFEPDTGPRDDEIEFRVAIATRYELATELGQGGMGTVYLANDRQLGRLVALKVVAAEAAAGVGDDKLLEEIALVSRLQHPNILPLFDAGARAGSPYYVMPYVRSGSLGAMLRARGRLSLDETLALVDGISAGLEHAHEHDVLHCDIKPENILVQDGHAWLMDFGIARKLHREAEEWTAVRRGLDFSAGTPAYVSPEQASGDRPLDRRSDIYSLACVVWEMLAGRPPFTGTNTEEIVSRRFSEAPPPLVRFAPEVPATVIAVIERAMSLDPDARPETAQAFHDQLRHAARGTTLPVAALLAPAARARDRLHRALAPARSRSDRRSMPLRAHYQSLRQDLVFAVRQWRRTPGLTVVALLTLAIGIGLTTAVFAIVDRVLFRPLPFPEADRLVALQSVDSTGSAFGSVSAANWHDWKMQNQTLEGAALYRSTRVILSTGASAAWVPAAEASPDFFEVLRARFVAGRAFAEDEVAAGSRAVVVSEGFWRQRLGAADTGLVVNVNGYPADVIGVVAAGHEYPQGAQVWLPFRYRQMVGVRNNINWLAMGRLAPGVTIPQARTDLSAIARSIREQEPEAIYSFGVGVIPLRDALVGDSTELLALFGGAVVLVLLVACANLASANLAQGAQRRREMAVRAALGAPPRVLVRQVLVEHLALALAGGALGTALAWAVTRAVQVFATGLIPRTTEFTLDLRMLVIGFVVATAAGLLTGMLPALQASRSSPHEAIGSGARGAVAGGRGLPGRILVGAEIAMALMLVAGAGLLVQSLRAVLARPLGFRVDGVATAAIALTGPQYESGDAVLSYWQRLLDALRTTPGVQEAAVANWVPLVRGGTGFIEVFGKDIPGVGAGYHAVSEGYFSALGMQLLEGRPFDARDANDGPRITVINRSMAERYWPGESPLGTMVRASSMEPGPRGAPAPWLTVIGVVSDIRHYGYESEPQPEMYVLYRQLPAPWLISSLTVLVRGRGSDEQLVRAVRETVAGIDPAVPPEIGLLRTAADRVTSPRRLPMQVIGAFGVLALLLASIGIYGVLSFAVARRTRELAVRAALGADRSNLLALVLGSGARVIAAGVLVGLIGALLLSRLIAGLLYGVSARDPLVLGAATLVITAVGLLAALLPARRATRADPMVALREE